MKKLPMLIAGGIGAVFLSLAFRNRFDIKYSDIMHEDAVVSEMHRALCDYSKDTQKNVIFFDGEIDFVLNDKKVYNMFEVGEKVDVSYREFQLNFYDYNEGKRELKSRWVRDYKLVNVQKKELVLLE